MNYSPDGLMQMVGVWAVFQITLTLACIALSWWVLQNVRWDIFLKHPSRPQAKILQIILSIVLGFVFCQFLLTYSNWSSSIVRIFE